METLEKMPFEAQHKIFKRLAEIADSKTLTKEEQEKYDNSMMVMWGRKVSKVPLHRPCGTSRVSCRSFLLWISSLCSHLLAQIHNKNLR